MALLDVKDLTKRFGGLVANKDISLSVEAGEIVAIIGPTGRARAHCSTAWWAITSPPRAA